MDHTTLIDVATLRNRLSDPLTRVIDCRFELGHPEVGRALYLKGHIPGAPYAHLDEDLAAPRTPWSGRHPLPDSAALGATFFDSALTIPFRSSLTTILAAPMRRACGGCCAGSGIRVSLCWTVDFRPGKRRVYPPQYPPPPSRPDISKRDRTTSRHVSGDDLGELSSQQRCAPLDARSPERFEGKVEATGSPSRTVPGAQNFHFARNLDADGCFLPPAILAEQFRRALRGRPPETVVAMCGSG
jgi:thiosulfate/3-mercaptopyruvate sulfurtransferase